MHTPICAVSLSTVAFAADAIAQEHGLFYLTFEHENGTEYPAAAAVVKSGGVSYYSYLAPGHGYNDQFQLNA